MSFPPEWALSIAAVGTAAVAIGLFMRSTRFGKKKEEVQPPSGNEPTFKRADSVEPAVGISLKVTDVERGRKTLKVLALERDALSMVISKFFEAEDEGEISKEDRENLSKNYEEKVKSLSDKIRQTELIVGLYELEKIREEIVKRFDAKLNETNAKIEELRKELKVEIPTEEEKKSPTKKEKTPAKEKEEEEEREEVQEKPKQSSKPKTSEIDEKIDKLRQEVLKELEELEKLEIDVGGS